MGPETGFLRMASLVPAPAAESTMTNSFFDPLEDDEDDLPLASRPARPPRKREDGGDSVGAYVSAKQVKSILVNAGVQWFLSRIRCTR